MNYFQIYHEKLQQAGKKSEVNCTSDWFILWQNSRQH